MALTQFAFMVAACLAAPLSAQAACPFDPGSEICRLLDTYAEVGASAEERRAALAADILGAQTPVARPSGPGVFLDYRGLTGDAAKALAAIRTAPPEERSWVLTGLEDEATRITDAPLTGFLLNWEDGASGPQGLFSDFHLFFDPIIQMPIGTPDWVPEPPAPPCRFHPELCQFSVADPPPFLPVPMSKARLGVLKSTLAPNPVLTTPAVRTPAPSCENPDNASLSDDCNSALYDTVQVTSFLSFQNGQPPDLTDIGVDEMGKADLGALQSREATACTGFLRPGSRHLVDTVYHCVTKIADGSVAGLETMKQGETVDCAVGMIRVVLRAPKWKPAAPLVGECATVTRLTTDRAVLTLKADLGYLAPRGIFGQIDLAETLPDPGTGPLFSVQYPYGIARLPTHVGETRPMAQCAAAVGVLRDRQPVEESDLICTTVDTLVGSSGAPVFALGADGLTLIGYVSSAASAEFAQETAALRRERQIPEDCGASLGEGWCNLLVRH